MLEGKYWKRKFNAVTAEYKKWRLFYRSLLQNGFKERQKLVTINNIILLLTLGTSKNIFKDILLKIFSLSSTTLWL